MALSLYKLVRPFASTVVGRRLAVLRLEPAAPLRTRLGAGLVKDSRWANIELQQLRKCDSIRIRPYARRAEAPMEVAGDLSSEPLEDGEDDDDGEQDEEVSRNIDTAGCDWAEKSLAVVRSLLADSPEASLELYAFHARPAQKHLSIRLDKLTDPRGSPTLDDISDFTRGLTAGLEEALGEEVAASLQYEVSSPGALRALAVPRELHRFRDAPMTVAVRAGEAGRQPPPPRVMLFLGEEGVDTTWRLLDVPENWSALGKKKGQRLSRADLEAPVRIPLADLGAVQFYLDIQGL
uniref:DUF7912 domain-containing protein n=2 Tax=Auxenochlorella protothecoides TaxID=3075 RepID=A0A1D1ZXZ7_AUXPR